MSDISPEDTSLILRLHREDLERIEQEHSDAILALQLQLPEIQPEENQEKTPKKKKRGFLRRLLRKPSSRETPEDPLCDHDETIALSMALKFARDAEQVQKDAEIALELAGDSFDRAGIEKFRSEGSVRLGSILANTPGIQQSLDDAPEAPGTPPRGREQTEIQPAPPLTGTESDCFRLEYTDVICPVCFDAYQKCLCHASLLYGRKTCGHLVCEKCVANWMCQEINDHRHFVRCPHDKCSGVFSAEQCDLVLGATSAIREKLRSLNTPEQRGLRAGTHMYCPSGCNHVLEIKKMDSVTRRTCTNCAGTFCNDCRVPWHDKITCKEYQQLPPHLKSAHDIAFLNLAKERMMRKCPKCHMLVDKTPDSCNQVVCRCKCVFCYGCGNEYKSSKPTAMNEHGEQGCTCTLFSNWANYTSVNDIARE